MRNAVRLWCIVALGVPLTVAAQNSQIRVDTVRTRVRPELEIVLPSGLIRQDTEIPVGNSTLSVRSDFNIYTGSIAGAVGFARPIRQLEPYGEVGLSVATEPVLESDVGEFVPGFSDDEIVERDRYARVGVKGELFVATTELSTELREELLLSGEEGQESDRLDLYNTLAWQLSDLRPVLPERTPETVGGLIRAEIQNHAAIDRLRSVEVRATVAGILNHTHGQIWRFEHRLRAYTPIVVFDDVRANRISVGGFDSVRGIRGGDLDSTRGVVAGNTVSRSLSSQESGPRGAEIEVESEVGVIRFHSLRAITLLDAAIFQDRYGWDTGTNFTAGTGLGIAGTVTVPGNIHFDVRSYLAVPIAEMPMPVIYLRTALFSFSAGG